MKKLLTALMLSLVLVQPSSAAISQISSPWTTSLPDDQDSWLTMFCQEGDMVENLNTGVFYRQRNCAGTRFNEVFLTPAAMNLLKQSTNAAIASTLFTGTTSQYVRGDGSLATLPSGSRSFNYPTRSLNTCFRPSATQDALVTYSVDIAATLSLLAGQQGTVYLEIYTNSTCTTGAQEISRFVNGNTGALTIGLNLTQNATGTLTGMIPAGAYVMLRTQNNTGTPTFNYRSAQEVLQ